MLTIGAFTKSDDDFVGGIAMPGFREKAVILPNLNGRTKRSPDYRVYANGVQIGDAQNAMSHAGDTYLSVAFNDPTSGRKIFCHLIDEGFGQHRLVWNR